VVVSGTLPGTMVAAEEQTTSWELSRHYMTNIRLGSHPQPTSPPSNDISELFPSPLAIDSLSLRPRYLCFIVDPEKRTYETVKASDYLRERGAQADTEFVSISNTGLQFRIAEGILQSA
jgi:hypothetical protein